MFRIALIIALFLGRTVVSGFTSHGIHPSTSTSRGVITSLSAERRQPWDVFRSLQQSSRFVNILFGQDSASNNNNNNNKKMMIQPGDVLWKAGRTNQENNSFTFSPLDDVIMGGISSSNFDDATGKWKGYVTDANNGGFIGIRSTPYVDWDMSACTGIEVQINSKKNNDMRLKIVLRDSTQFNGIGWSTSKDVSEGGGNGIGGIGGILSSITNGNNSSSSSSSVTIKVPFINQVPTRFAKIIRNQSPFKKSNVRGIQFVYSKFEYDGKFNPKFVVGEFDLQIEQIVAY